ncbi:unnamed protein product [Thelazia callipaeda]|uniref:Zinc finger, C2H2 type n=1 Tax=Thelazia callipaeda TaxID=103827 RepID=A0A158RBW8_THECL|nr:unnamed protein product [Thelazia callipaeda]
MRSILQCTPVICEQGPSAPSSPTIPGGSRLRRPYPLNADAIERMDLLSASYLSEMDWNKLSPLSPNATSDLGSSPRSSISLATDSLSQCWACFRESKKSSLEGDGDSDICSKDLLSPCIYSPAPLSPFSDCTEPPETPLSGNGIGISPAPSPLHSFQSLHFNFDSLRSSSSLSDRVDDNHHHLLVPESSLDLQTRERSHSDGEFAVKEKMDTSPVQSTISIPVTSTRLSSTSGQYKKRLLQKYEKEQEDKKVQKCESNQCAPFASSASEMNPKTATQPFPQSLLPSNEPFGSQQQFNAWIQHQLLTWRNHWYHSLGIPGPALVDVGGPRLLTLPDDHTPRGMLRNTVSPEIGSNFGPMRIRTTWRRSRSESDVNSGKHVCQHCGQAFALHDRLAKHIASRHRDRSASEIGEDSTSKTYKCTTCNRSFSRSDMLTRHMRLHTGIKPYGCQICGQVFSRSDHLSTHQRTHTGEKPYGCPQCNYAASRRDMITRHMRTHVRPPGSPEFNPLAISQLSLNQSGSQLQQSDSNSAGSQQNLTSMASNQLYGNPLMMRADNAITAATVVTTTEIIRDYRLPILENLPLPSVTTTTPLIGLNLRPSAFTPRNKLITSLSVTTPPQTLSSTSLLTLPSNINNSLQLSHSFPSSPTLRRQTSIGSFSTLSFSSSSE